MLFLVLFCFLFFIYLFFFSLFKFLLVYLNFYFYFTILYWFCHTLTWKIWNASRICVSSLRRGHANLLCIVPILVYVLPKRAPECVLVSYNEWNKLAFAMIHLGDSQKYHPEFSFTQKKIYCVTPLIWSPWTGQVKSWKRSCLPVKGEIRDFPVLRLDGVLTGGEIYEKTPAGVC